ncbi:imidazoleglycerol-phosphate dehydratase HisB [Methanococcus voltae]|uniref:Imidazoleglycerol-phosphate dehydratase n=1 Tax=Methanococcus voltae TaxID=2188 RepID=A0A8J7UUE6_METVO|nr:imidazoleglycerol-phosphate dehydratase HisB [Methanococcus voltae]MBP2171821.1 imidazoleglycerol-phosphate dehydratase [Methanococcus voltae]MBP2201241.1 imidazoleglycerol-phosphate dehydratase [Methanococcus voltae]
MRKFQINRETKETKIGLELNIDGTGVYSIVTGIPFFDHVLNSFSKHGSFDLNLRANGDLEVDDHHTVEDVGIVLGQAFNNIEKANIKRFGWAMIPMDEAKATFCIDIGGRPYVVGDYVPNTEKIGNFSTENVVHFFESFANHAKVNIHFEVTGKNEHHKVEALFKAFGIAMDMATQNDNRKGLISTKGTI